MKKLFYLKITRHHFRCCWHKQLNYSHHFVWKPIPLLFRFTPTAFCRIICVRVKYADELKNWILFSAIMLQNTKQFSSIISSAVFLHHDEHNLIQTMHFRFCKAGYLLQGINLLIWGLTQCHCQPLTTSFCQTR